MITPNPTAHRLLKEVLHSRRDEGTFLFYGPEGSGLLRSALNFVLASACERREELKAEQDWCGQCSSCKQIHRLTYPDLLVVRRVKKEIQIDMIRHALYWTKLKAFCNKRYLVIEEAERMNAETANAALKLFEEPAEKVVLILTAHHPWLLLPTVLSRAFKVFALPPSPHDLRGSMDSLSLFYDGREESIQKWKPLFESLRKPTFDFYLLWRQGAHWMSLVNYLQQTPELYSDAEPLDLTFRLLVGFLRDEMTLGNGGNNLLFPEHQESLKDLHATQPLPNPVQVLEAFYRARILLYSTRMNRQLLLERAMLEAG